jgi:hypothetical protein
MYSHRAARFIPVSIVRSEQALIKHVTVKLYLDSAHIPFILAADLMPIWRNGCPVWAGKVTEMSAYKLVRRTRRRGVPSSVCTSAVNTASYFRFRPINGFQD